MRNELPFEYAGLKLDDVLVCDYFTNKELGPINIEDVLSQGINLRKFNIPPNTIISLSFKTAIQFMKKWIDDLRIHSNKEYAPLIATQDAHGYIYHGLSNYEVLQVDKLSSPPQYDFPMCSASRSDLHFLPGCILQLCLNNNILQDMDEKVLHIGSNYKL